MQPALVVAPRAGIGLAVFGVLASLLAVHLAVYQDRAWALIALAAVPVGAAFVIRRPSITAAVIICASLLLMLSYSGIGYSDQTDLGRAALQSVLAGETPYRVHDLGTHTNPFAYGPLAMLGAQIGVPLEVMSAALVLVVLAWSRSWVTLGAVAAFPPFVHLALTGINDYTPTLIIVAGLLAIRSHPRAGMILLAVAAAVKPYAAAWLLPGIGYVGWQAGWFVGVSLLLWTPMLPYAADFLAMIRLASSMIGFPLTRLLVLPLGVAALFARQWQRMVLLGAGIFAAMMLFGSSASLGYWIVLLPAIGIACEGVPRTSVRPDKSHRGAGVPSGGSVEPDATARANSSGSPWRD